MKFQISSALEKIQYFIQLETFILLSLFLLVSFVFYKIFLKKISTKRHTKLKERFLSTFIMLIVSAILSAAHWNLLSNQEALLMIRISDYSAFFSLFFASMTVIKLAQIEVYLYLFFKNISQGIPRLIVNLFTVIFSLLVFSYLASEVFLIHITTMLATSAVFSLVLGLALQDTLGNLFSGVAMQIGEPFAIGDWVEISHDTHKWTGQIQEITWRATFLSSFSDEWIMIPNKTIAQSQIIIFTNTNKILRQSLLFRIDFNTDLKLVKKILNETVKKMSGVLHTPETRVLIIETTESWVTLKVFYSIEDFSLKYRIADQIYENTLSLLAENNIKLAQAKIQIQQNL